MWKDEPPYQSWNAEFRRRIPRLKMQLAYEKSCGLPAAVGARFGTLQTAATFVRAPEGAAALWPFGIL